MSAKGAVKPAEAKCVAQSEPQTLANCVTVSGAGDEDCNGTYTLGFTGRQPEGA